MAITPIMRLPAIPAPWTIPMKRTTPVEGAVSGVQQVRAMLADQAAVPMLERRSKDDPDVVAASATAVGDGAGKASAGGATARGAAARRADDERESSDQSADTSGQSDPAPSMTRLPPEGITL